ncbi:hypothetical protein A2U01_0056626, partial [Trifolium medium]|nr:hypothetical protein [Trifolium medium]
RALSLITVAVKMTSHPNGHFPANLPILNGKNYDNWCKQMKVCSVIKICDIL